MSYSAGHRCHSDLALLWLWLCLCLWPAAAAPIQPLAWELLHAAGAAIKRQRKKKKKRTSWEGVQAKYVSRCRETAATLEMDPAPASRVLVSLAT